MGNQHSKQLIKFRVLIIGRANAGKTSILQRVCATTDSPLPFVLQKMPGGLYEKDDRVRLDPSMERGEHSIQDEFVFSNHDGYIFHDSCGFEAGSNEELAIVQGFVQQMSGKRRLQDRLHAIWYCVPMDNHRPELDLKYFNDICPDRNVPVIAVFTKYDQFLHNVKMHVEDYGKPDDNISDEAERQFKEHYLRHLGDGAKFVRLEKMNQPESRCHALLEETVEALNDDVVALMLLAVQTNDLELSIREAVKRVLHLEENDNENISYVIKTCLFAFPQIWFIKRDELLIKKDRLKKDKEDILDKDTSECFWDWEVQQPGLEEDTVSHVMSLSTTSVHTPASNSTHHFTLAIILIFKRAALLCISGFPTQLALTQADSEYRNANIASIIEDHLVASDQDYSIEQSIGFLINTHIEPSEYWSLDWSRV